jgi:16S rRNA (cytosine967-C5)-methyltransferase
VQTRLLAHAAASVKPGGKLIYSVCTLTRAETEGVAKPFSGTQPAFEPLILPAIFSASECPSLIPPAVTMTIWPQDLGGNGMFVAAWRRRT